MRNWNEDYDIRIYGLDLFILNLWGIETVLSWFCLLMQEVIYIEPMRNWNPSARVVFAIALAFILNLWGIETQIFALRLYILFRIYIEPMRNWNSSFLYFFINAYLTFILNLWGIETAFPQTELALILFHLYWTYEELKLNILPFPFFIQVIYIEPMRNWNEKRKSQSTVKKL